MSIVLRKLNWANEQVKDNEEEGDLSGGEDEEAEVGEGLLHPHQLPNCHRRLVIWNIWNIFQVLKYINSNISANLKCADIVV